MNNLDSGGQNNKPVTQLTEVQGSTEPNQPPHNGEDLKKPKNKKILAIGLMSLILVVAVTIGTYVFFSMNEKSRSAEAPSTHKIIKIGLLTSLNGDSVATGTAIKQGVQLAMKEFNKEGITVQLVTKHTGCSAELAGPAAKQLIETDKVVAIIGDICSGATLKAAKYAERDRVPLVSPASTSPKVTDAGDYIFRTIPSDALQGKFIVEHMRSKSLGKLAILYGNEPYGIGLNESLTKNFQQSGGLVVANEAFENESIGFDTQFQKIKATKPDVVYMVSNSPTSTVAMLLAFKKAGISAVMYGSESFKSDAILKDIGDEAEGLIISAVSDGTQSFQDKYEAIYGIKVDSQASQAYDAFKAISLTLEAGAITSDEIKDALYKVDFDGVSGRIKFDTNGDIAGNYFIHTIKNKKYVLTP